MTPPQRHGPWLACLGLAGLLVGCQPASTPPPTAGPQPGPSTPQPPGGPTPPGATPFDADSEPFSAGKKVFVANNCFRCHAINGIRGGPGGPGGPPPGPGGPGGPGRPGGRGGPDLGKVGADEGHTAAWLMEYVRNPKSKKADARMPPFADKIRDDDLMSLGDFLAGLK